MIKRKRKTRIEMMMRGKKVKGVRRIKIKVVQYKFKCGACGQNQLIQHDDYWTDVQNCILCKKVICNNCRTSYYKDSLPYYMMAVTKYVKLNKKYFYACIDCGKRFEKIITQFLRRIKSKKKLQAQINEIWKEQMTLESL